MRRHRHVVDTARDVCARYGFAEMATPIFEPTEVFRRTLGESSDIVTKEMFEFETRGGEKVVLRPEGTAGVVRALISNGLAQSLPLKLFYSGPMFRYERPQKGRQRQFHQIGVELLGVDRPAADVEVVAAGADVLRALGVLERTVLEINTLGDGDSRDAYRAVLVDYLMDHHAHLSEDSRGRLDRNPLRVLDSKDPADKAIVADAPDFADYLTDAARDYFDAVLVGLDALGVAYTVNTRLVRGLDYYCHTAFEFTTAELGSQGAVIAGGRYDGLVEQMGGPAVPGIGWAGGIERLALLAGDPPPGPRPVAVVPLGEAAETVAFGLAHRLRLAGQTVEMGYSGNLKKRMRQADRIHARAAVIIGDDELARDVAVVRDLDTGEQEEVALANLEEALARFR